MKRLILVLMILFFVVGKGYCPDYKSIYNTLLIMSGIINQMMEVVQMNIDEKFNIAGRTVELSASQKVDMIAYYNTLKSELADYYQQLP